MARKAEPKGCRAPQNSDKSLRQKGRPENEREADTKASAPQRRIQSAGGVGGHWRAADSQRNRERERSASHPGERVEAPGARRIAGGAGQQPGEGGRAARTGGARSFRGARAAQSGVRLA
ncbi:MAG: hypothetical protein N2035_10500 [Chthoniobacterales bacterium]|nr:hypothetical protein [Chthoniobacterales bacterium]